MWSMGLYVYSAVSVSIEHAFCGKKAKSKYFEKPITMIAESTKEENLTEEQKKRERNALLMKLQLMMINFNLNKKNQDEQV